MFLLDYFFLFYVSPCYQYYFLPSDLFVTSKYISHIRPLTTSEFFLSLIIIHLLFESWILDIFILFLLLHWKNRPLSQASLNISTIFRCLLMLPVIKITFAAYLRIDRISPLIMNTAVALWGLKACIISLFWVNF